MTSQTPAGWYPDPGQVPDGPRTERWWDGARWTDQTRPATTPPPLPAQPAAPPVAAPPVTAPVPQPPAPGMYPAYGNYPGYPGQLPPKPRNRGKIALAAGVALVVLAGIVGGVYALTADDGGGSSRAGSESQRPGEPGRPDGPGGSTGGGGGGGESPESPQSPKAPRAPLDEGYATDILNGVALPVLEGWTGSDGAGGAGVQTGTYKCPDDVEQSCVKGGASIASAKSLKIDGTTAEAAAEQDIVANAKASYGGEVYGGIVQHDELLSEKVTVAGQQGYRIRWNVDTKSRIDAWVESVVFPSPSDAKSLLVVRIGVDIPRTAKEKKAGPDDTSIDKLVKGIKKASVTGGATGGDGQDV
ncbi:DUF2510 domain-containing protein [Streptomyces sp. NPDC049813]|uniref:DUF2510 domain-containing protein n=1 Tax=Streptomyces sp. NPDC049813 TaxID=3365597 RepID=UPI003790A2BC